MMTLVEQLQRDAADPSVNVATLLRRAKISAKKLGLKNVEKWIEHELSGYPGEVPDYRCAIGRLMAWNPYRGWIPMNGDAEVIEHLSTTYTQQSIDELENLLSEDGNRSLAVELSPHNVEILNRIVEVPLPRYVIMIGRPTLIKIMNAVRNAVLEWSLALEEVDIKGTDFSFTPEEKRMARERDVTIRIDSIGSFVGNLGVDNVTGGITNTDIDVHQVRRLVEQIRPMTASASFTREEQEKLTPLVNALDAETSSLKPENGKVRSILQDVRNVLSGASGNLIASGLAYEIGKILTGG